MAYEAHKDDALRVVAISRKEAVELIAFLAGHLAGQAVPGNHTGVAPEIRIIDRGVCVERIGLMIDDKLM